MERMPSIDVSPEHYQIVCNILQKHLPPKSTVWIFGSRATGNARKFSDLDLAIDAGHPLSLSDIAALNEAFEGSDLPYKVDILDWLTINEDFKNNILDSRVNLSLVTLP